MTNPENEKLRVDRDEPVDETPLSLEELFKNIAKKTEEYDPEELSPDTRPVGSVPEFFNLQDQTESLLSPSLKNFIEERYESFRENYISSCKRLEKLLIEDDYEHGDTALLSKIEDFTTEIRFNKEEDYQNALLRIMCGERFSSWMKFDLSEHFPATSRRAFIGNIKSINKTLSYFEQTREELDFQKLGTYVRCGFRPGYMDTDEDGNIAQPSSITNLFIQAAESHGFKDIYVKEKIIDLVCNETDITFQENDRNVTHGNENRAYILNPEEAISENAPIIERRIEMLQEGAIFIKPQKGAGAYGVYRLTLDEDTLTIESDTPLPSQFYSFQGKSVRALFYDNDRSVIKETREDPDGLGSFYAELNDGTLLYITSDPRTAPLIEFYRYGSILTPDSSRDISYCLPGYFLKDISFTEVKDGKYVFPVDSDKLSSILYALEVASVVREAFTYAEVACDTVLYEGKTWEIRQLNLATGLTNLEDKDSITLHDLEKLKAGTSSSYVKLGSDAVIANISQGGSGRNTSLFLNTLLETIAPDLNKEERDFLINTLTIELEDNTEVIGEVLSKYLTEARDKHLPQFPLKTIPADSFSTDYIVIPERDSKSGKITRLKPIMIDLNLQYGFSGLREQSETESILFALQRKSLVDIFQRALFNEEAFTE